MKKSASFMMALIIVLSLLAGCKGQPAQETTPTQPTPPPEVFATVQITGDWTIVHDGSSDASRTARELQGVLSGVFGKNLEVLNVANAPETAATGEIIIGDCRDPYQWVKNGLCDPYDYAMKVRENALVLCANNALSYKYLMLYLRREVLIQAQDNALTLDSEDNIQYTTSALQDTGYVQYLRDGGGMIDLAEIFDWGVYQNADTKIPYRIYVPFNYKAGQKYPLLVNLHGAGLRGEDNIQHLSFIQNVMNMDGVGADQAIIIFPQCPENQKWVDTDWTLGSYSIDSVPESNELKAVMELIGQLQQTYSIDENRIYACGFSMGGYGTWDLLLRHPDVFCAGVPMCGAGDPEQASKLLDVGVWAIHGGKDPTVPVQGSRDMAEAMEALSATNIHYTELPGHEHDVWNYTYTNWEIFSWLFSQSKA